MKKILLTLLAAVLAMPAMAQDGDPVAESTASGGNVTLAMTDGTTLRGYARTQMKNEVRFFELSDQPKGKRTRYDNDQIERITFDNGATFVKQEYVAGVKGSKTRTSWLQEEYLGRGIALYSGYHEQLEQVGTMRRWVKQTNYYLSLNGSPAFLASVKWHSGGVINGAGFNRTTLNYLFTKQWPDYADFAKRVKAKEFNTKGSPMEVVKAWEESYGK